MKNHFGEDIIQNTELYNYLKKHFQFLEIDYVYDGIGLNHNGNRYYIRYNNIQYIIYFFNIEEELLRVNNLSELKIEIVELIGKMYYNKNMIVSRHKKLNRIL